MIDVEHRIPEPKSGLDTVNQMLDPFRKVGQ